MKTLIINTIPHTGTHTLLYLFHTLGGIPMYWEHFEERALPDLVGGRDIFLSRPDDFVFLQTERALSSMRDSYARRMGETPMGYDEQVELLTNHLWIKKQLLDEGYPQQFIMPIEARDAVKTQVAVAVFKACGVDFIPLEALQFMQDWKPLHAFKQDNRGFKSRDEWRKFKPTLNGRRFKKLLENDNGT